MLSRQDRLCSVSSLFFSFWPRLLRLPLGQQLDSCIQSENTHNSRRFKRGNFTAKCSGAPALQLSFLPGTRGSDRPRPAALVSAGTRRSPAGGRILPEVPSRPVWGAPGPRKRGEAAPRAAVPGPRAGPAAAVAASAPRRPACRSNGSSAQREPAPCLLGVPASFVWASPPSWVNMAV